MTADPTQGSDVERAQRAQAVYQMAMTQPQQIINIREAALMVLESMNVPDIEKLAPEPDPNAVDPDRQLMLAQMGMDAELKKKDQELRERGQNIQEARMAHDAAKTMAELGLKDDETEAKIAEIYSKTLKNLVDAGIASGDNAMRKVDEIERAFIDSGEPKRLSYNPMTGGLDARDQST